MTYRFKQSLSSTVIRLALLASIFLLDACSNSKEAELTSSFFTESGETETISVVKNNYLEDSLKTDLPIVKIFADEKINTKETWLDAAISIDTIIYNAHIKGRGNSTWIFPKKPYTFKFESKQSVLGMPASKKWILLANYRDRTLIRNAVSLELARLFDFEWVPQGRFVEVFLNDKHLGNYYLVEKVEVGKNRLNIGPDGFLLELDAHYDDEYKFKSGYWHYPVNIKYPSEPDSAQFAYIESYIDTLEQSLHAKQKIYNYREYLDQSSFARYYLFNEVLENHEITFPNSVFVYKDSDSPLMAGPPWDYDCSTFRTPTDSLTLKRSVWYYHLFDKPDFVRVVKQEWQTYRTHLYKLSDYIDSLALVVEKSNAINYRKWPIHIDDPNGDEDLSFEDAIDRMKNNFYKRLENVDRLINAL